MTSRPKHVGTVKIGAESYLLAETDDKQAWQQQYLHEPPWAEGLPPMLSEPSETWHLGGLKSKQGIPGTSEYGQNTDGRFPFRLLPGPEVIHIAVPTADVHPVTSIFEALGYIWFTSGRYVYRVDPATDVLTVSKDFGGVVDSVMGIRSENNTGLVCTLRFDQTLWEVTAVGILTDTWAQAEAGVAPYRLAAGIDRLFGVEKSGLLRNVVSGLSPLVAINWADRIQCGETATLPTGILAFEKTVLVGKPEGLFGVSPEGKGVPLISRVTKDNDNFKGMIVMEPHAILPHSRGTYRFVPGLIEVIGLEQELMNESVIRGRFKAFAVDGPWLIGFLGTEGYAAGWTHIMVGRERRGGEPGFGPLNWDTWVYDSVFQVHSALLSSVTSPPRLWYGERDPSIGANRISYIKLSAGGGAPDVVGSDYRFATSGLRYTNKYTFGDWRDKDFPKIVVVGKGTLSATRYWDILFSVDGGAYSALDIDGNTMKVDSDGLHTFYLPLTAVGREVQFRFDFTGDSATAPPELSYFEPFAVPQSQKIPVNVIQLHLSRGAHYDTGNEHRSAAEQLSDLAVLDEAAAPLKANGPWGEDKDMWLRSLKLVSVLQEPDAEAEYLVEVTLQERRVS